MSKVTEKMNVVLADSFAFYLKTHFFHWNVKGRDFYEYHKLFELIYEEVYDAIDDIAEHIRAGRGIAYGSFTQYKSLSSVEDATSVPTAVEMVSQLVGDNQKVIESLRAAFAAAEQVNEQGMMNFIAGRIEEHQKHGWMLESTVRDEEKATNESRTYILDPKNL